MKTRTIGGKALIWAFTGLAAFAISCNKERVEPALTEHDGALKAVKPRFFLSYGQTYGTYSVYKEHGNCYTPWGAVEPTSYASNSNIIAGPPSYMRASSGSCPLDANFLCLQRGDLSGTANSWGPWYLICPNWGPGFGQRKWILIRVKKTIPLPSEAYQAGLLYDAPTNTWLGVDGAIASGNFEVTVHTGVLTICGPGRE